MDIPFKGAANLNLHSEKKINREIKFSTFTQQDHCMGSENVIMIIFFNKTPTRSNTEAAGKKEEKRHEKR